MDIKQFGLTASLIEAAKKCMSKEELTGGQKKIDANKNGKLDAEDFKKLRGEAKMDKEDDVESAAHEKKEKKKEMKADEGYVSHAQRKAVWASRNDDKKMKKEEVKPEMSATGQVLKKLRASKMAKEEVQIDEAGPFSYGAKPPRKGSVAYNAMMKRKEQEKGKQPVEPKDQMVGVAKVVKEAFPTVADAIKKDKEKSTFDKKKISTGTVYTKKYKDKEKEEKDAKGIMDEAYESTDAPFEGPYSKKKSAIPGKYGIGPSTAKHLARMAMNKQTAKAKKESNK